MIQLAVPPVMQAEILSCSRNRGTFAGISLEGSTLRCNHEANKNLYGKELNAKQIILQREVRTPFLASSLSH